MNEKLYLATKNELNALVKSTESQKEISGEDPVLPPLIANYFERLENKIDTSISNLQSQIDDINIKINGAIERLSKI